MAPDDPSDVYPLECSCRVPGVPRRFGVGVLLILMTFFAVLFAVLRSFDYGPKVCAIVGVLFVGVAAGQSLLFRGQRPRKASLMVGALLFPLEMLAVAVYEHVVGEFSRGSISEDLAIGLFWSVPGGALFGYLAGTVTAGIFLVMERLGKTLAEAARPAIELQPLTESDIELLLGWVKSLWLLRLWAGSTFSYPLDRPQLECHLRRAVGEDPELRVFKAVCCSTGRAVGCVELADLGRGRDAATIRLALIGPAESNRGELSVALLRAILAVAFDQMRLHRVQVAVLVSDWQSTACYKQVGLVSEGVLRDAVRLRGLYGDQRVMSILRHEWIVLQRSGRGSARAHAFPES